MLDAKDHEFLMFILACGQSNEDEWNASHDRTFDEAVNVLLHKMERAIVPVEGGVLRKTIDEARAKSPLAGDIAHARIENAKSWKEISDA